MAGGPTIGSTASIGQRRGLRRVALAGLSALILQLSPPAGLPLAPAARAQEPRILVVSRGRVLEEAAAARRLAESEVAATEALQRDIDAVKAELAAEEEELTRLRAALPREEFERRVAAFDQRVREERRRAQSLAASLQRAYRDARRQLVDALAPILDEVRTERGAIAILDAASVLVADPAIDVTGRVIELYDQRVSVPVVVMPDEPGTRGGADPSQPDAVEGTSGAGAGDIPAAPGPGPQGSVAD
ncbi:OmpH family outer membrane protein [Limibaculum sp. FT325]|uniref:OmpH family outer membrane protein n=1 Tax=Thermohalobaculum sediminis TaxID=2939436 RepID=UPI0020BFA0DF|nr:OmpH family outer membrane protein [Limibaculum sediminis]MCL5777471.1 OmpH family outer membrane protein [Limibaculum sediminis]